VLVIHKAECNILAAETVSWGMSRIAIQLLTLATCVTALVVVPALTPAKAAMSNSRHLKKHKNPKISAFGDPWSAGQACVLAGLPVGQAASARASPEASSAALGLLQFMMILTEKFQALMAAERTLTSRADECRIRF